MPSHSKVAAELLKGLADAKTKDRMRSAAGMGGGMPEGEGSGPMEMSPEDEAFLAQLLAQESTEHGEGG